jgi:hypothetical protein
MRATFLSGFFLAIAHLSAVFGQAPGVPIETQEPVMNDREILAKATKLREAGELLNAEDIAAQLGTPKGGEVPLVEPSTTPMKGRDLARRARESYLRLGWYYRCKRCDNWHLNFAGAYAIGSDVIATCYHCVEPNGDMREGYLIALDTAGNVLPVTAIVAANKQMDGAILRVKGTLPKPLALQDNVAPGDTAYCFSEPLGQYGYFSTGIINRFVWLRGKPSKGEGVDKVAYLRVNVSTDWAPGSSGAAVLDECGNVIGHVARISPLSKGGRTAPEPPKPGKDALAVGDEKSVKKDPVIRENPVLITLHEAIPARAIRTLAQEAKAKPAPAGP